MPRLRVPGALFTRLLLVLVALSFWGCASSGTAEQRQRRDPNAISAEELRTASRTNALDLVETVRPRWLRARGPTTFDTGREPLVAVYVDGQHIGGPAELRLISVASIASMRFLNPQEASARFGFDHSNGAILITSRSGR